MVDFSAICGGSCRAYPSDISRKPQDTSSGVKPARIGSEAAGKDGARHRIERRKASNRLFAASGSAMDMKRVLTIALRRMPPIRSTRSFRSFSAGDCQ